ncbi:MAG: M67 family metallopeptidase [Acidobacteria bacterium]|nr:M67 family metallopeptidase [Acidobacteriota bacterium]
MTVTDVPRVVLAAPTLRAVLAHAARALPDECCGLLIGSREFDTTATPPGPVLVGIRVEASVPARNLRRSPTRYLIDPADHFAAIRAARAQGRDVVGAYHSHPTDPPDPSATDHRDASGTQFLYLIVSPATGAVKAFRPSDGRLSALPVCVQPDPTRPGW